MKRALSLLMSIVICLSVLCGMTAASAATVTNNIIGDIDRDGDVTTVDVRDYLLALVTEETLPADKQIIGDINGDNDFTTADVRDILKYIVEDSDKEPVRSIWIPYFEVNSFLYSGDAATARSKIDACLQDCADKGANTVYFHVRANSDAFYNSAYFDPNANAAPLLANGFDPLACAVELAHAKGLKIEAWVNPYRIGSNAAFAKSDDIFQYGTQYYYIPGKVIFQSG